MQAISRQLGDVQQTLDDRVEDLRKKNIELEDMHQEREHEEKRIVKLVDEFEAEATAAREQSSEWKREAEKRSEGKRDLLDRLAARAVELESLEKKASQVQADFQALVEATRELVALPHFQAYTGADAGVMGESFDRARNVFKRTRVEQDGGRDAKRSRMEEDKDGMQREVDVSGVYDSQSRMRMGA